MKCQNKAEYLCPWAGKQVKACEKHAKQLSVLGQVIGSPIQVAKVQMEDMRTMNDEEEENK
jgi:hypothetical protein